ncbi:MAG: hypothetical protein ACI8QC_001001 [Planctomycetota bacterium]|jgi:hypothetical protein
MTDERNWKTRLVGAATALIGMCVSLGLGLVYGFERLEKAVVRSRAWRAGLRMLGYSLRVGLVGSLVGGAAFGVYRLGVHRVPPGSIGVSQVRWGTGIEPEDHTTGLYFAPGNRWHHLDGRTHEVRFAWPSEGGTQAVLSLVTPDGETLQVAAGVLYHIQEDSAWELVRAGLKSDYHSRAVAIARRVLLEEFQTLQSEDWFEPEARAAVARTALAKLGAELGRSFLEAEEVLISGVYFQPGFETKRLERQLDSQGRRTADALVRRRAAELNLAEVQAERDTAESRVMESWKVRQQALRLVGDADVATLTLANGRQIAELKAAADDDYARALLAGEQALAAVHDLHDTLEAQVLGGEGGRTYLAREAARKLTVGKVVLDSSDERVPSLLDMDSFARFLLGD